MKKVLSISLGSSDRNHKVIIKLDQQKILVERIGTDGDLKKARELLKKYDGLVDAFGLGGIDLSLGIGKDKFKLKEAYKIIKGIKTPIFDGGGVKNTLDKIALSHLIKNLKIDFTDKKVFLVCACNRSGMAQEFENYGCKMTYGDFMFGLKVPIPIHSLKIGSFLARLSLPLITKLPQKYIYPIGKSQKIRKPKFVKYFNNADIIAGDFHYIYKYSPYDLSNKIIITTTTTKNDILSLKKRGVSCIITTTPNMDGRSFGCNVVEAILYSYTIDEQKRTNYEELISKLKLKPTINSFES
tara:strand:- start:20019 stop:20912 length:894 start_codon:yes stop_codon:yes gene_type:complete